MQLTLRPVIIPLLFAVSFAKSTAGTALPGFPPPRVIQTHSNIFGSVLFWDATSYVERFASIDTPPREALRAMEYEAVKIFVSRAPALARDERHLRIVVSFTRTGAFNERYQTAQLNGVEALFTLDGNLHRPMKFAKNWERQAKRGILPAGTQIKVLAGVPAEAR